MQFNRTLSLHISWVLPFIIASTRVLLWVLIHSDFYEVLIRYCACRLSNFVLYRGHFLLWSCFFPSPDWPSEKTNICIKKSKYRLSFGRPDLFCCSFGSQSYYPDSDNGFCLAMDWPCSFCYSSSLSRWHHCAICFWAVCKICWLTIMACHSHNLPSKAPNFLSLYTLLDQIIIFKISLSPWPFCSRHYIVKSIAIPVFLWMKV